MKEIAGHELTHKLLDNGQIDRNEVLQKIQEDYTEEQRWNIAAAYNEAMFGADLSNEALLDEIICDAYGGMNNFSKLAEGVELDDFLTKVEGYADQSMETIRNAKKEQTEKGHGAEENFDKAKADNTSVATGNPMFSIKNTSNMTLDEQLRNLNKGSLKSSDSLYFGETPSAIQKSGLRLLPLAFRVSDYKKSTKAKHNVPRRAIKRLSDNLSSPILSFGNSQRIGFLVDDIDGDGKPLLIGIEKDVAMDNRKINAIRSVYGLDDPAAWIQNQIDDGKEIIIYDEKKADSFLRSYGYKALQGENNQLTVHMVSHPNISVKQNFSTVTDSEGRTLSEEQREFFADTVQPIFNEAAAKSALKDMEREGGYYQPIGGSVDRMMEIAGDLADRIDGKRFSTVIDTNPSNHSIEKQKMIDEYVAAVDTELVAFVKNSIATKGSNNKKYSLDPVSDRAGKDIEKYVGFNPAGYKTLFEQRMAEHIINRHGSDGAANKSMQDVNDIGRMQYVIDHYDDIEYGGKSTAYVNMDSNGKNRLADIVVYKKSVDGMYYVVEAVPNTKSKTVFIVSAYMAKNKEAESLQSVRAKNDLTLTPNSAITADSASKNIVSPDKIIVNKNLSTVNAEGCGRAAEGEPVSGTEGAAASRADEADGKAHCPKGRCSEAGKQADSGVQRKAGREWI